MEQGKKTPYIKTSYITIKNSFSRTYFDYEFLLVLNGTLRIRKDQKTFFLEKNDVFFLECGNTYSLSSGGNNIILSIVLEHNFFHTSKHNVTGHYVCNSALDSSRDYTSLRKLLSHIAIVYFDDLDKHNLNLISQAYSLLYYINTYHFVEVLPDEAVNVNTKYKQRISKALDYIHKNFASNITLQQTADYLNLSAPYLSAFFKDNLHENFNSYVNRIRLEHATDDLIYTDKSITSITFDNGFPSSNAFNKLFRETYQTTPNKFRKETTKERLVLTKSAPETTIELNSVEQNQLLQAQHSDAYTFFPTIQFPSQVEINVLDMQKSIPVNPIWKKLINIGPISLLSNNDIFKQIEQIQDVVGFQYARISHVIDYKVIPRDAKTGKLLFTSYDRATDILSMNNLIPYLDLSYSPDYINNLEQPLDLDTDSYLSSLHQIITHSANMFGPEEVQKWYFEINRYVNEFKQNKEDITAYIERFTKTYQMIKQFLPTAKVGGICHDALFDYADYITILNELNKRKIIPDFLSIGILPYELIPMPDGSITKECIVYTSDKSFALHKVAEFKHILSTLYSTIPEVHVAYFTPDIYFSNYINDTCFQSTFYLHNTIDLIGEVEMLGYHQLSDIAAQPVSSNDFLEGKNGLFNKYGIKKPGCQLLSLFSPAHNKLVEKGNDYVVLKGQQERYLIGLCNYTYIDEVHRLSVNHTKIHITDAYSIFENPQTKNISLKLYNMVPGEYDIILYQINKSHGSALDEWARNMYWDRFTREELEYMRKTLQPLRTHSAKTCDDGTLSFNMQLTPHEVVFIKILYRW